MAAAKKVIVLGFDGSTVEFVQRYMARGKMPNHSKLMKMGTFMANCLCPYPTITPPNWTTIATGARIGTHGITCFWQHHDGDPLDQFRTGFDSRDNRAEYIWARRGPRGQEVHRLQLPLHVAAGQVPGNPGRRIGPDRRQPRQAAELPHILQPRRGRGRAKEIEGWLYQPEGGDIISRPQARAGLEEPEAWLQRAGDDAGVPR